MQLSKGVFQLSPWHPATCANQDMEGTMSHFVLPKKKKYFKWVYL